jgi:hypothetical protein
MGGGAESGEARAVLRPVGVGRASDGEAEGSAEVG